MAGKWTHDWHGDILVIKTTGLFSYDEAVECTASTLRQLDHAPEYFALVADLSDYPTQPSENDSATLATAQAFADLTASGRMVGLAIVTAKVVTKLQIDRWKRQVDMDGQGGDYPDVETAIEAMKKVLADSKV